MATALHPNQLRSPARGELVRRKFDWVGLLLAFMVFYTVALPKGGIKAAGVPLTIGYVLTIIMIALALLRAARLTLPIDRLLAFGPCLLLGGWSAIVVAINGTSAIGFTISYFISALYLPLFGMLFFSGLVLDEHHARIERALLWAVRFVVVYGIFLFLFKQATGRWIEIPYITVNAADAGQLDDKFINRGGIFKLISTYNNGNIFGVSLAIMAPLYLRLETRRVMRWALYAAMFLTLSRTVWIGAILVLCQRTLAKGVRPLTLLYLAIGLLFVGATIFFLLDFLGVDTSFILDSSLGGRRATFNVLDDFGVLPQVETNPLPEIVYLGILRDFGVPGLLLFALHLLLPSHLLALEGVRLLSPTRASACLQGLLIYPILACADGAYSYIPVMMIFWMVAGMGFWYAHRQSSIAKGSRETSC